MLSTLSALKARLAIPAIDVQYDDLLTTALTAIQAVRNSAATDIQTLWNAWDATFPARPNLDLTVEEFAASILS